MELTMEYLLAHSSLTAADFEGVDFADFVSKYELTEASLEEYDISAVLALYKRSLSAPSAVDYTTIYDQADGTLTQEDLSQVSVVIWELHDGNANSCMVVDRENCSVYHGSGYFLNQCTQAQKITQVNAEDMEFVRQALADSGIVNWKTEYVGTDEGTTETFSWSIGIRLEDGRCFLYSGRGMLNSDTPEQMYPLLQAMIQYFSNR